MKKISIIILILIPLFSYAKEVTLSDNAVKTYGITTIKTNQKSVTLPRSAIVVSRDNYFVYLKNKNSFEEIQIHPSKVTKDKVTFQLKTNEEREFVTNGSPYLRIIFLNSSDE